jgi:aryl-alcohol dehydrogenase-like predicted oxidoreductase
MKQAAAKGYGIIVRMPLQFGLLTGKFTNAMRFDKDDHRHSRVTPQIIEAVNDVLEKYVWSLCEKYQTTKTALALSFILSYEQVSTVIPGIRTPQHAIDNTTGLVQLDEADKQMLESLFHHEWTSVMQLIKERG